MTSERRKSIRTEFQKRIYEIYTLILQGADRPKIMKYAREEWDIGERQTDQYIALAKQWIKVYTDKDKENSFNRALAQRDHLLFKAHSKEDIGLCHEILKDMGKLCGLYPIEKTKSEVTIKDDHRANLELLTDEEAVQEFREAWKKHANRTAGSKKD
jgi:hypothetical protein